MSHRAPENPDQARIRRHKPCRDLVTGIVIGRCGVLRTAQTAAAFAGELSAVGVVVDGGFKEELGSRKTDAGPAGFYTARVLAGESLVVGLDAKGGGFGRAGINHD